MARKRGASAAEIEAVYRRRRPELLRVAAAIVGDRDTAPDVVQDAFASALRHRRGFRGEGALDAWLWRLVVNAAKSRRRAALTDVYRPGEPGTSNGHGSDLGARIRVAVSLLPERQRLVLFLRYYGDLDYSAIADVLGISVGTVGSTLTAAREAVRDQLEEVPR